MLLKMITISAYSSTGLQCILKGSICRKKSCAFVYTFCVHWYIFGIMDSKFLTPISICLVPLIDRYTEKMTIILLLR